ncbi:XRE family transcriptional regulator [Schleiferilactobacillus harbinensis]|uniref:helix-turn-helix domain-containing protein n=1 Tax=Schleiferilactobacillus harbinensis TaxID=304207 RepID=UPI0021A51470|nr:helix-turn-helix transcriptional regulator [Schleiferilactobacillus harbinensis]MCT2907827.1 XRE family transcriptional regulator [Schleiferilactobacillus harbinensis]
MVTTLDNIKHFAKLRGLTLASVAERAGLSSGAIYRWETAQPRAVTLDKVAHVLGVSSSQLLAGSKGAGKTTADDSEPLDLAPLINSGRPLLYNRRPLDHTDRELLRRVLDH